MSPDLNRHIACPCCGYRGNYRLADCRRKCRRCGKKYSSRLLKSRLPARTLKRMALLFWLRAPVMIAARELRIDPKTVRRHYNLIRHGIFRTEGGEGQASEELMVLSLLVGSGADDRVIVNAPIAPLPEVCKRVGYDWKYGEVIRCPEPLKDIFCRVYLVETVLQEGEPIWLKKLDKLAKIACGVGCRATARHGQSQQMLLSEISFRYNHRNDPGASAILYSFFKNS